MLKYGSDFTSIDIFGKYEGYLCLFPLSNYTKVSLRFPLKESEEIEG